MHRAFNKGLCFKAVLFSFVIMAGALTLGGQQLAAKEELNEKTYIEHKCFDYYRRPVLNVRNDSLSDVAFSDLMRHRGIAMGPMMIFNLKRLARLSKASRTFFVMHECGHHALGHLYFRARGRLAEQEADCYAIRTLIRRGTFTLKDVSDVQEDMRRFAKASLYHVSGKDRANQLLKCIES